MASRFGSVPKHAPSDYEINDILVDLEALVDAGTAVHFRAAERRWTRLMQIERLPTNENPTAVCFLFTVGDRDGAQQGFQHMETGEVRIPRRHQMEGNARSAHLLVHLTRVGSSYPSLLEDMEGLGKTNISETLSALLKLTGSYEFSDTEDEIKSCRPTWILEAVEDRGLQKELESGQRLRYLELVTENSEQDFDEVEDVTIEQETLRVTLDDDSLRGSRLVTKIRELAAFGRSKGFTKVKVIYKRPDAAGNRTVTYDTQREDAEDFLIKRIKKLTLNEEHPAVRDDISRELAASMAATLTSWNAE